MGPVWQTAGERPAEKTNDRSKGTRAGAGGNRSKRIQKRGRVTPSLSRLSTLTLIAITAPYFGGAVSSEAAEAATAPADPWGLPKKPAWLSELSLSVRESYDNNAFLAGTDPRYLPAGYVVPAGSVAALRDQGSWVTTVSPKIGVNYVPLLGDQKTLQALALGYAPDFVTYHDESSESYNLHRFTTGNTSDGIYGFARGATITRYLLEPALAAAEMVLPRNRGREIDGFAARHGIIRRCYDGVLGMPPQLKPRPFEIVFETPQGASPYHQTQATVAALLTILAEYRQFMAYAVNL